jgi:Asp-tRNA(Asn)/Glu-tRNA(Gln) amidotransferase B subunit
MKKIILVIMMGLMVIPSFAQSVKGKKKHRRQQQTEVMSEVRPIHRERWVEKNGKYYVTRTTITAEDYRKIRDSNR